MLPRWKKKWVFSFVCHVTKSHSNVLLPSLTRTLGLKFYLPSQLSTKNQQISHFGKGHISLFWAVFVLQITTQKWKNKVIIPGSGSSSGRAWSKVKHLGRIHKDVILKRGNFCWWLRKKIKTIINKNREGNREMDIKAFLFWYLL